MSITLTAAERERVLRASRDDLVSTVEEIVAGRLAVSGAATDASPCHPNCAQHGKSRCAGVRCDGSVTPAGQWAELLGPDRIEDYEMVERRYINVGDHVYSSYWGANEVIEKISAGTQGQTVELRFASMVDHEGHEYIRNERYDADLETPRKRTGRP